jgi:cob(I)alamin adenosyltransferase
MNKEKLDQMAERLMEIPELIFQYQGRVLNFQEEHQNLSDEILQIEMSIKTGINNQVDENNKKVYSNAESREAAFLESARTHDDLIEKRSRLSSIQNYISIEKFKLEKLGNEQRNIRSLLYFFGPSDSDRI